MSRYNQLKAELNSGKGVQPLPQSRYEKLRSKMGGGKGVSASASKTAVLDNRPLSAAETVSTAAPVRKKAAKNAVQPVRKNAPVPAEPQVQTKAPKAVREITPPAPKPVSPSAYGYDPMVAQDLQNRQKQTGSISYRRDPDSFSAGKLLGDTAMRGVSEFAGQMGAGLAMAEDMIGYGLGFLTLQPGVNLAEGGPLNTWYQAIKKDQEAIDRGAAQNIARGGKAAETVYKYGTQTVAAVPQVAAAMMTGGASAAASSANLARTAASAVSPGIMRTVSDAAARMAKNPQYWTSFAQTVGPGYQQALADGADHARAAIYGVSNGLANAAVEVGGGLQKLPGALQGGESLWRAIRNSATEEGTEEVVQGVIERTLQNVIYNKQNPLFSLSDPRAILNPRTAAEEYTGGAVVGGILSGGQAAVQTGINAYTQNQIQKQLDMTRRAAERRNAEIQSIQRQAEQEAADWIESPDLPRPIDLEAVQAKVDQGVSAFVGDMSGRQQEASQNVDALKAILDRINAGESFESLGEGSATRDSFGTGTLTGLDYSSLTDFVRQVYASEMEETSTSYLSNPALENTPNDSQLAEALYNEYVRQVYPGDMERSSIEYQSNLDLEDIADSSQLVEALSDEYARQINARKSLEPSGEKSTAYDDVGISPFTGQDNRGLADLIQQVYPGDLEQSSMEYQSNLNLEDTADSSQLVKALSDEYVRQINARKSLEPLGEKSTAYDNVGISPFAGMDNRDLADFIQQVYTSEMEKLSAMYPSNLNPEIVFDNSQLAETLYDEYTWQAQNNNVNQILAEDKAALLENLRLMRAYMDGESHNNGELLPPAFPSYGDASIYEEILGTNLTGRIDNSIIKAQYAFIQTGGRIIEPEEEQGEAFAKLYYEEIRHFTTDVDKIARNIGKSKVDIQKIKNYLFVDSSLYDEDEGIWRRFDPDCAIAQSWQRLMVGKDIKPHDLTLIEHELLEMQIKKDNPGISHSKAHEMAQEVYNYTKGSREYYGSLKKNPKDE